jgi:hypothetical protein
MAQGGQERHGFDASHPLRAPAAETVCNSVLGP